MIAVAVLAIAGVVDGAGARRGGAAPTARCHRDRRLLALIGFAIACAWRYLWLADDAFISLHYARNWIEGHGLVFNPGERVDGYATPFAGQAGRGGDRHVALPRRVRGPRRRGRARTVRRGSAFFDAYYFRANPDPARRAALLAARDAKSPQRPAGVGGCAREELQVLCAIWRTLAGTMPISGMNHFTVLTDDLDATEAFYVGLLGLRRGFRPDLGFPGAWLYAGDHAILHVIAGRGVPANPRGAIDHMAFSAVDLRGVIAQLTERGIAYDLRRPPSGGWQLFCFDPSGARVELDFDASEPAP